MCRQRMWRQNVASQENVASPNNVAPKCGVTGKCGVAKQCGAKQCGGKMWRHRKMWRHQTMWRQTMQRQNVASQENAASPSNVAPNNVAPHVFEMCLHNVSSASGGKVRALLPTPCIFIYRLDWYNDFIVSLKQLHVFCLFMWGGPGGQVEKGRRVVQLGRTGSLKMDTKL